MFINYISSDVSARQDGTVSIARKSLPFATLKIPTSFAATVYAWASLEHRSVTPAFAIKCVTTNQSLDTNDQDSLLQPIIFPGLAVRRY